MGRKSLIALIVAASGAILLPAAAKADTKDGVDAWTRGDFAGAVREWQAAAAKGDSDAIYNLGEAYRVGKGVPRDLAIAEEHFGRAAAMGHLQASDTYGVLLFQRGERQRALPFIRAAADRGDPRAQYFLGIAHFNGDLVPKDWVRAYALVSLAHQQNLPQAASALTQMDQHIPMAQRQQAVTLAADLQAQADATRARQLAAVDLGAQVPTAAVAARPRPAPAPAPVRGPSVASANEAASTAGRAAEASNPATAGADYTVRGAPPVATTTPPPTPRPIAVAAPPPAPAPAASGKWRVQLGAFAQPGNADALWSRVRHRPELAGKPRLSVKAGSVTRLQAGGFASEGEARAACGKLKAAGFECSVVAS
ncbi:MAG: SPOR domain-containing protein [Novosphingobium sp.]